MKARRTYQKARRAEAEQATRLRIVEALLQLHEEVGPARTTVSAVAERAGVERLTVYRHFPDETAMIRACSACWTERNPFPTLRAGGDDPVRGCRAALLRIYSWYRQNARMLDKVIADADELAPVREAMEPLAAYLDDVAATLSQQWPHRNAQRQATLRHAIEFATWRSLDQRCGTDRRAAALVMTWLKAFEHQRHGE